MSLSDTGMGTGVDGEESLVGPNYEKALRSRHRLGAWASMQTPLAARARTAAIFCALTLILTLGALTPPHHRTPHAPSSPSAPHFESNSKAGGVVAIGGVSMGVWRRLQRSG